MATRRLNRSEWQTYFSRLARGLEGKHVEIEIAGLRLGDQIEAEWTPLIGVTYDPKDDLFEIATENVDHLIRRPKDVHVQEDAQGLHCVEIVNSDGNHQIIKLRSPLALPSP